MKCKKTTGGTILEYGTPVVFLCKDSIKNLAKIIIFCKLLPCIYTMETTQIFKSPNPRGLSHFLAVF